MIGYEFYMQFGCSEREARTLDNVARVRDGLRHRGYDAVRLECFNKSEAEDVRARLTAEEQSRTLFSWGFAAEDPGQRD